MDGSRARPKLGDSKGKNILELNRWAFSQHSAHRSPLVVHKAQNNNQSSHHPTLVPDAIEKEEQVCAHLAEPERSEAERRNPSDNG